MTPRWRAQDGSLTLELVILAPAILFILALVIAGLLPVLLMARAQNPTK